MLYHWPINITFYYEIVLFTKIYFSCDQINALGEAERVSRHGLFKMFFFVFLNAQRIWETKYFIVLVSQLADL